GHVGAEDSGASHFNGDVVGVPGGGSGGVDTGGVEARRDFGETEVAAGVAEGLEHVSGGGVAESDDGAEVVAGDAGDLSGNGAAGVRLGADLGEGREDDDKEKEEAGFL